MALDRGWIAGHRGRRAAPPARRHAAASTDRGGASRDRLAAGGDHGSPDDAGPVTRRCRDACAEHRNDPEVSRLYEALTSINRRAPIPRASIGLPIIRLEPRTGRRGLRMTLGGIVLVCA